MPPSNRPDPSRPDRQREHQANERTFLAWLRTSIALIGFGFAIARFGLFIQQFEQASAPSAQPVLTSQTLGIALVIFGIVVIVLAAWRYNQVFLQIEQGAYRPNRWAVWLLSAVMTILGLLSLPLLSKRRIPEQPPSFQPSRPSRLQLSRLRNPAATLPIGSARAIRSASNFTGSDAIHSAATRSQRTFTHHNTRTARH
jgi:putative membrane protein